ncbi:MAG: hypothetical protein GXP14_11130 [Gammaproteobacteria bacterium]|nr:hypothetical protein [Gammaproteobacteria bacterium]
MANIPWGKLKAAMPALPRRRYNIFCGTNSFDEWRQVWRDWRVKGSVDQEYIIQEYECNFVQITGAQYGVSFGAGRMALYAILEALRIGEGDEVIIPAFTCVVVPNAIIYRNAIPVYVDIESRTFNIDVEKIEKAITPRTRALYAQHTFGVLCDIDKLKEIGRRHHLPIIEDGAHALGTCVDGNPVGSLTEVAFFTTDHSKVINTHLGGIATTNDKKLAERLRDIQVRAPFLPPKMTRKLLRTFILEYIYFSPRLLWVGRTFHILLSKLRFLFYFSDELKTELPTEYPFPCRLSAQQARLGISQLDSLNKNIAHRKKIAVWLERNIGWYGMSESKVHECAWLRYSFLVKDREAFAQRFSRRFDLGVWFTSVVQGRNNDLAAVGYIEGSCPTAEWVVKHIVNFPTHPRIPLAVIQEEVGENLDWLKSQIIE